VQRNVFSKGRISEDFIDLITKMLVPCELNRISISEIKEHTWYQQPAMCVTRIKDYFENLKSAKKSKSKNTDHNKHT